MGIQLYTLKVYQVNSAAHMGSIQENVHNPMNIEHNDIKAK